MRPPSDVDGRADRAEQGTIGVVLLAGFVFRWPWLPPIVAVLTAVGALAGPRGNPLHWLYGRTVGVRLSASAIAVGTGTVRSQDAFITVVLVIAGVMYAVGISVLAWLLTVAAAIVAIIAATTGVHLGDRAIARLRH